jgi:hypothetical protein
MDRSLWIGAACLPAHSFFAIAKRIDEKENHHRWVSFVGKLGWVCRLPSLARAIFLIEMEHWIEKCEALVEALIQQEDL